MTNPTSYTDEQVLDLIRYHDKEDDALTVSVLNFFREDRQRLQAEVERVPSVTSEMIQAGMLEWDTATRRDKVKQWPVMLERVFVAMFNARDTPNETKEAKS